jgi:hypothetical protein
VLGEEEDLGLAQSYLEKALGPSFCLCESHALASQTPWPQSSRAGQSAGLVTPRKLSNPSGPSSSSIQ